MKHLGYGWASEFRSEYRCVQCDGKLSWIAKMDSMGTCPLCGHNKGITIVITKKVPYRLAYTAPCWMFWKPKVRIYKEKL